ncbi:MAG TPA: dihydroneopterin aldolase [Aestuariivirgaceae bacterium]|nr:dihydroneopterin aldolase [Aestuariivirgaceae bacterium]
MGTDTGVTNYRASGNDRLRHVFVRDLEFMALLGVYEHEKRKPQRIVLNIDLSVREDLVNLADDIENVVSYEAVVRRIEAIVAEGHVHLAETLAERIAEACLADERVSAARVRVEKPDIIPNARSVGVEIERLRQPAGQR